MAQENCPCCDEVQLDLTSLDFNCYPSEEDQHTVLLGVDFAVDEDSNRPVALKFETLG